jgi:hypothetical protein
MDISSETWWLIAVAAYAFASEVIGLLPTKDNTVVQLVMTILGKILGKKS